MWMEARMREKYELTVGARLGTDEGDDHEGLVLNRVVRWTQRGLEYEADPRQAERLVDDLQLEGANSVTTPGVKPLAHQIEAETPMPEQTFSCPWCCNRLAIHSFLEYSVWV